MLRNVSWVALALGCGTSAAPPTTVSTDTGTAVEDVAADDVALAETAAPCGVKVGDVLCDVALEGHFRDGVADGLATESAYGAISLGEALAKGTQKYALVWTSAYW